MKSSVFRKSVYALSRDASGFGGGRIDYSILRHQRHQPTTTSDWDWERQLPSWRDSYGYKTTLTPRHYGSGVRGFGRPRPPLEDGFRDTGRRTARNLSLIHI